MSYIRTQFISYPHPCRLVMTMSDDIQAIHGSVHISYTLQGKHNVVKSGIVW